MTDARSRLEAEAAANGTWGLYLALRGLSGTLSFLQTGAHPDDETSGLLAMLVRKYGLDVAYACATRGEGGQNALGPERGDALGVLRTVEMEVAAARLGIGMHWLSAGAGDAIRDFGFSKSAEDTLRRWGHARALERFVRCIRHVRPDILCPTFNDVAGQHGHHRAVTRLTTEAFEVAGDSSVFPEHAAEGLRPWSPALLYLPAWSGAGGSYDDEIAPPVGHVRFDTGELDPIAGVPYSRIGEWAHVCHLTQEMGEWVEAGPRDVALSLAARHDGGTTITDRIGQSVPASLGEWAQEIGSDALGDAQIAIDRACAEHADGPAVLRNLHAAYRALTAARVPASLADRLSRKAEQIQRVAQCAVKFRNSCPPMPVRTPSPSVIRKVDVEGVVRPRGARVAYLGGGLDLVSAWLAALEIDVVDMPNFDPAALLQNGFTTALIGIRAFERRVDLNEHIEALHAFVREGGNLVTLYHRPDKGWRPDRTPLARIEIGRPSIRWRVCDPEAPIEILAPDHRLLVSPNRIGPADWIGWKRERGLYFSSDWDPAYLPLLRITEPGEAPHLGGLLSGKFGKGRHTHAALALHNEIEFGTKGALRMLCNLVSPEQADSR